MKFSIIFDNYKYDENLQGLWGFGCVIEIDGQTILFDTGSNGRVLLKNAKQMGIDFKNIDILFISHSHWDHIGGLDTIIEENPNITLIIPSSISNNMRKDLISLVKKVIVIDDNFTQISENLYSTGILGNVREQSLIIKKNDELFIVSGCSHFGIDKIFERTIENLNLPVKYIIGGFHLMRSNREEIEKVISKLNSKFITATHCTGDLAIEMIKNNYNKNFFKGGVGAVINI